MSQGFQTSFGLEDIKQLKEGINKVKEEVEKQKSEGNPEIKQPLGNKIGGFIVLLFIIVFVVVMLVLNYDMLFLPKNTVVFTVTDQNGNAVEGLELYVNGDQNSFYIKFDEYTGSKVKKLNVKPDEYTISLHYVPENYDCSDVKSEFILNNGDKYKFSANCVKK